MKRLLGVPLVAVVVLAIAASTANACYCGAARYRCCQRACCCPADEPVPAAVLHGHEDLQGGRVRATAVHLLQDVLRAGVRAEDDQLREVRPRDMLPGVLLHGLQARVGDLRQGDSATRCASRCGRPAPRRSPTRSASRCGRPARKEICYTVCKPVWETCVRRRSPTRSASRCGRPAPRKSATRSASRCGRPVRRKSATRCASRCGRPGHKEICYTVCKPVWETRTKEILLHGVQAGVGNQDTKEISTRSASRCRRPAPRTSATRCASRCMRLGRRSASTRCASRCGRPAPRRSATRSASRCTRPASARCATRCASR